MGLQRKVGSGIYTQALQSYQGGPCSFGGVGWDHAALGCSLFAMWPRQQERLCLEEKGRKDSCWWAMRRCHIVLD